MVCECDSRVTFNSASSFRILASHLGDRCAVIFQPLHHVLPVELGNDLTFLDLGAGLGRILQNEHELGGAATAASTASGSTAACARTNKRSGRRTEITG